MSKKYKLLIVESPAKSKTIQKYLGNDFIVVASKGHIMDLPSSSLGVDLNNHFEIDLAPLEHKKDTIKMLKEKIKDAEHVYLATDPDREGEAIAFHLLKLIKKGIPYSRVTFNEITKNAVTKAVAEARDLDVNMYESQKTRRVLDRLVGYKISPLLWNKITSGLSAGRVQSIALRIIVEREDSITNFIPEHWFSIKAPLLKDKTKFLANYFGSNRDTKSILQTKEDVEKILSEIKEKEIKVVDIIKNTTYIKPSPPFTTSKLQQDSGNKLNLSTKKTMEIAQRLYEGISLGDLGTHGLITYMRTDSTRSAPEAIDKLRAFIKDKYGENYLADNIREYGSKSGKVQDAHEAIRPSSMEYTPDIVRKFVDEDTANLYELIWNKFVSSQMVDAQADNQVVWIQIDKYFFKSQGSIPKFNGFKLVYEDLTSAKRSIKGEDDEESNLPELTIGEIVSLESDYQVKEEATKPPSRYTEMSLVNALEKKGVGRPSTYSAIISNINDKQYVSFNNKKQLYPTDIGYVMSKYLTKYFPKEMDISFTAEMENKLDKIEEGSVSWLDTLKEFWGGLEHHIIEAQKKMPSIKPKGYFIGQECNSCHEHNTYLTSYFDKNKIICFSCNNSEDVIKKGDTFVKIEQENKSDKKCPKCDSPLIIKHIHKTKNSFYGCSSYPSCTHTEPFIPENSVKCYSCDSGYFLKRTTKSGATFYGCSNFPKCNASTWGEPISEACIFCSNKMIVKNTKKDGTTYKQCPRCQKTIPN